MSQFTVSTAPILFPSLRMTLPPQKQSLMPLASVTMKDENMHVEARHAVPWAGGFETRPYKPIFVRIIHSGLQPAPRSMKITMHWLVKRVRIVIGAASPSENLNRWSIRHHKLCLNVMRARGVISLIMRTILLPVA
jgi:hypothetical protein